MNPRPYLRRSALMILVLLAAASALLLYRSAGTQAAVSDYAIADSPLYLATSVPPLMMMVASRDEQLFERAYDDYSNLGDVDGDGLLDPTYNNAVDYEGYFDPYLCYAYDAAGGVFKAAGNRTTDHRCGGAKGWSGNFLNWLTMTRLDILRYVLYGGQRAVDTPTKTVLERAQVPSDTHAWSKVYRRTDIANYVGIPGASAPMTFCNVSLPRGQQNDTTGTALPQLRYTQGAFPSWSVTEFAQCLAKLGGGGAGDGDPDRPAAGAIAELTVRIEVCNPNLSPDKREKFCAQYGTSYKPVGLLQEYGEPGRLRFGLITGTFSKPRAGGVLRKNIGLFAGNGNDPSKCVPGDEVKLSDGTFCNNTNGSEGIVNTLGRFKLAGVAGANSSWNKTAENYTWADCTGEYGTRTSILDPGSGQSCPIWGNPISEMYAEALRYLAGETSPTSSFVSTSGDITGAPAPAWVDPYAAVADGQYGGGNNYCANCSVMVLSSGTNTFDGNAVPAVSRLKSASEATNEVGTAEGISGSGRSFFVGFGASAPDAANQLNSSGFKCTATVLPALSYVRGICDDAPQREGSYLISGLAKAAFEADLRPDLSARGRPANKKTNVTTYAVALAETLPKIEIKLGGDAKRVITISPSCTLLSGRNSTCQLVDTQAGKQTATANGGGKVYGRDFRSDGKAGSFMYSWDGASMGESNDRDVVFMITYCVGSACNTSIMTGANGGYDICWGTGLDSNYEPAVPGYPPPPKVESAPVCKNSNQRPVVGENEVLVRVEGIGVSSGGDFAMGFSASGADADNGYNPGVYRRVPPSPPECGNNCGPGSTYNLLTGASPDPANVPANGPVNKLWRRPVVRKFTSSGAPPASLQAPLWYAAKYGTSVTDSVDPDVQPDWDNDGDGQPDNYLLARDPAKLKAQLRKLIEDAAAPPSVSGGGASGARLTPDASFTVEASFRMELNRGTNDWSGKLAAYNIQPDGSRGAERWDAGTFLDAQAASGGRTIRTVVAPTQLSGNGGVTANVVAKDFTATNLTSGSPQVTVRSSLGLVAADEAWLGTQSDAQLIAYLRGASNGAPLRERSSILGDIIDSGVEIASPRDDYGYGAWALEASPAWKGGLGNSYKAYLSAKPSNNTTAFVGANDGMLHAFDATASGGRERFAYIPSAARERMGQLANPNYRHQYTMNGEIVAADVPTDATGGWRTVLVASTGTGGRSVSALNITDPNAFNDASVLWELRGSNGNGTAVLDDLGYVLGRPVVVPVTGASASDGPRWVALFGNGANSATGAPVLFVVDVNTGAVLAHLKPQSGYNVRNGLINIAAVALYNNDGVVDTVYGGDLQGNVWKFDLSKAAVSDWKIAFSGAPLFTAKDASNNPQPITGGLEVTRGPGGGAVVYFGTGRYFAVGDNIVPPNPPVQSFYGLFDRCSSPSATCSPITDGLTEQVITAGLDSNGYRTRQISRNTVGANGWFINLRVKDSPATGERFLGTPRLQNGRVFFTTFEPIGNDCAPGGLNWLFGVDMISGSGAMAGVSPSPGGDSVCGGNCGAVAVIDNKGPPAKSTNVLLPQPPSSELTGCGESDPNCSTPGALANALASKQCTLVLRSEASAPLYLPRPCGRQSWRQVR
ncbi:pilus assembly protein [Lysobacter gummosus]|uniref:pilus assembly protein n=1 Tax=Lysobacter gummosus TaxID=262324 RepID=UPI0036302E2D